MQTQVNALFHPLAGRSSEQWADEIAEKILALRALTDATGTRTTRTQNELLQSLPGDVLLLVATKLKSALGGAR